MDRRLLAVLAVAGSGCLLFFHCSTQTTAGNGSHTGNPAVAGVIYGPDGVTPARDAVVTLVSSDNTPSPALMKTAALPVVKTDSLGRYQFSFVAAGTYNVLAGKDSLRSIHDSVLVDENGADVGNDTLRPAASITGQVLLEPGDDPRTVMILVIGTTEFVVPKTLNGDFTIPNLAQGDYEVRFLSTLDSYYPKDTVFHVVAGEHDTLGSPIRLPFRGVPAVTGVSVVWDSLLFKATISWQPLDTSVVAGYKVFRGVVGNPPPSSPLNAFLVTGNTYVDSTCGPDSGFYYFVAAVNGAGQQGNYSRPDTIRTVGAYKLIKIINGVSLGTSWTQFAVRNAKLYWMNRNAVEIHDTAGALLNTFGDTSKLGLPMNSNPKIYGDTLFVEMVDSIFNKANAFLRIKKYNLSGSYLGLDSLAIGAAGVVAMPVMSGDFTMGDSGDIYYTEGSEILRFRQDGIYDKITSPLSSQLRQPIQRIEYFNSVILNPMSLHNITTNVVTTEIALLSRNLVLEQLTQNDWWPQGFSVSPSGQIFLIVNTDIRIVTKDMVILKKIPIPVSLYKDVEVDVDGTVYLYDYGGSRIMVYAPR